MAIGTLNRPTKKTTQSTTKNTRKPAGDTIKSKSESKPLGPRFKCSFDRFAGKVNVYDPTTGETTQVNSISLRDVTFTREAGKRDGCVETGYLGFVTGYKASRPYAKSSDLRGIKWEGTRFVTTDNGSSIDSARGININGSGMFARV